MTMISDDNRPFPSTPNGVSFCMVTLIKSWLVLYSKNIVSSMFKKVAYKINFRNIFIKYFVDQTRKLLKVFL